jgi:O-methyltransferase domain
MKSDSEKGARVPDFINSDDDRVAVEFAIQGFQVSRTIRLVADLLIADRIVPDVSSSVADLASASGVLPGQLLRAIRLLATYGIFRVDADETVAHTPRSLLLRSDTPHSLHESARFWTAPGAWRAWEVLDAALEGGNPYEVAWGVGRFDYMRSHPEEARLFDTFMAKSSGGRHNAIATSYDFSRAGMIADIGGGNGETLRRILAKFPGVRGLVFDREDVVAAIAPDGLADGRIGVQSGNFFEEVPAGADIYLMAWVLHDWPNREALRILRSCRTSIGSNARLLIVEVALDADPSRGRPSNYFLDMQMMAMYGSACERTEDEFRALLSAAGFDLVQVIGTPSAVSILEAVPR